jgi:hypothetical protein
MHKNEIKRVANARFKELKQAKKEKCSEPNSPDAAVKFHSILPQIDCNCILCRRFYDYLRTSWKTSPNFYYNDLVEFWNRLEARNFKITNT